MSMVRNHALSALALAFAFAFAFAFAGCSGSDEAILCSMPDPCTLELTGGDLQTGQVGQQLPQPFAIKIVRASMQPMPPQVARWRVVSGGGSISPEMTMTDMDGATSSLGTLGSMAGDENQVFEVSIEGFPALTRQFTASAIPGPAVALEPICCDTQIGVVGEPLPQTLRVRVVDRFGNPVPEFRVVWSASAGGGSVRDIMGMADDKGESSATAVLGTMAGERTNIFSARAEGLLGSPVQFIATARPGPPAALQKTSGDRQGGTRGQILGDPLVVRVTDIYANPVRNATVTFSAGGGGGSITPASMLTGDTGTAAAIATLGPKAGQHEFIAALTGVSVTTMFTATAFPPICSADNWCWYSPIPQGNDMRAAYSVSPEETWVVGDHGTVLLWNGVAWQGRDSGSAEDLTGVWGIGAKTVAVGSGGTILTHNAGTWTRTTTVTQARLNAVWGTAADDIWAVGEQGTILHYENGWNMVSGGTANLNGVFGFSRTDVWFVGDRGTILRWDGMVVTPSDSMVLEDLQAIWGAAPDDLWAVGERGSVLHWDGVAWSAMQLTNSATFHAVYGSAANDIWTVGDRGTSYHWNGARWDSDPSGVAGLYGLARPIGSGFMAVGEAGVVVRRIGNNWQTESSGSPREIQGVWAARPDDVWAVGFNSLMLHFDGMSWSPVVDLPRAQYYAISGTAADQIWVAGSSGTIIRWNGTMWSSAVSDVPEDLYAIWARTPEDVWAVGEMGAITHWNGTRWSRTPTDTNVALYGVYAASDNEAWAVGDAGTILKYDGMSWQRFMSPTTEFLLSVRGLANDDIWATGTAGTILFYNGFSWIVVASDTTASLYSLFMPDTNNIWAVGARGAIQRWNGFTWSSEDSGTSNLLYGVYGGSTTDIWAVGEKRTLLRWKL